MGLREGFTATFQPRTIVFLQCVTLLCRERRDRERDRERDRDRDRDRYDDRGRDRHAMGADVERMQRQGTYAQLMRPLQPTLQAIRNL